MSSRLVMPGAPGYDAGMGIKQHPLTNLGGIGGVLGLLQLFLERLLPGVLGKWWAAVSEGVALVAAALLVFWLGAQVRQWENGDHWVQAWWRKMRTGASLGPCTMRLKPEGSWFASAEAEFHRDLRNVVIRTDTYKQVGMPKGKVWRRTAKDEVLRGQDCSSGHIVEVPLMQSVEQSSPALPAHQNALATMSQPNALARAFTFPRMERDPDEGFYHVRVTITATGLPPVVRAYEFEWQDQDLRPLPLVPEATEYDGNMLVISDGIKTLCKIKA